MKTPILYPNSMDPAGTPLWPSRFALTAGLSRNLAGALLLAAGFATSVPAQDLTPDSSFFRVGDGKKVVTFSTVASGTWTIPAGVTSMEVLVVGGGGSGAAGGTWNADGGGAGGVAHYSSYPVTPGAQVALSVGGGGAALAAYGPGNNGSQSVFDILTAPGGEGGLNTRGGNAGSVNLDGVVSAGGLGATNDGSNGGGGAGQNGTGNFGDSPGGNGLQFAITGANLYYAGGGGGGFSGGNNAGGLGGGGKGANEGAQPLPHGVGHDGVNGLGGGGGASRDNPISGAGGSGVVIVAYQDAAVVTYTVNFNSNGGSSVDPQIVPENTTATEPTAPTRTGYTFNGWFSDEALTLSYDFQTPVTANLTLYAKWTINSFTLTYLAGDNGSITGDSPQTVDYGASGTAVTAVPAPGYSFLKWSDESLSNPRNDSNVTADLTVTAIFVAPFSPDSIATRGDGKTVATFSTVGAGSWIIPDGVTEVEVLVLGGGGAGARGTAFDSPGGGAGGLYYTTTWSVTPGASVNVAVGAGAPTTTAVGNGANGQNSVFGSIIAYGGEGGIQGEAPPGRGGNQGGHSIDAGLNITPGMLGGTGNGAKGGAGAGENGRDGGYSPAYGGAGVVVPIAGSGPLLDGNGDPIVGFYGNMIGYAGGGSAGFDGLDLGVEHGESYGGGSGSDPEGQPGTPGFATLGGGGGGGRSANGGGGGSGVVIIAYGDVVNPPDPYVAWAGPEGYNLVGGKEDDDDGDGLTNFEEFAFGLDPTSGASVNPITDLSTLKTAGTFSYTRLAGSGLTYTVWVSTDLVDWGTEPVLADQEAGAAVDGVETVLVTLPSIPTAPKYFVRVKAE